MTSPARKAGPLADLKDLVRLAETNAHADSQVVYRRLRAEWGEVAPVELEPGVNAWLVMGYDELSQILRQERRFAKSPRHWRDYADGRVPASSPLGLMMFPRPNVYFADGDEHRRLREPVNDAVSALRLRQVSRDAREACSSLIARFAARGRADLVGEYALMIPALAIGRMVGLDLDLAYELHQVQMDTYSGSETAQASGRRFEDILTGLITARRAAPTADMTSVIVHHPNMTDESEQLQQMYLLVAAAAEQTMSWIGGTLQLMLSDQRFLGRMRGGRLGVDDALDEVLWRDPPLSNLPARYALQDTELGGQQVRHGDPLILCFAAANDDPRAHSDDQWNEIGNRAHLAWGAGPHTCPAQVPARIIVRTAVETALHQLHDVKLTVPVDDLGRVPSPWARCPATLPVTFTPAG